MAAYVPKVYPNNLLCSSITFLTLLSCDFDNLLTFSISYSFLIIIIMRAIFLSIFTFQFLKLKHKYRQLLIIITKERNIFCKYFVRDLVIVHGLVHKAEHEKCLHFLNYFIYA